jgi:3-dehydroquinate dehydratase
MAEAKSVLFLNGPNLNMLGTRQPEIYGYATLQDVEKAAKAKAAELGMTIDFRQSNSESELVGWVQQARGIYRDHYQCGGLHPHLRRSDGRAVDFSTGRSSSL